MQILIHKKDLEIIKRHAENILETSTEPKARHHAQMIKDLARIALDMSEIPDGLAQLEDITKESEEA